MTLFRRILPAASTDDVIHHASPEAIARAFANRLTREFGEDASRLADIVVAQVQQDLRGERT